MITSAKSVDQGSPYVYTFSDGAFSVSVGLQTDLLGPTGHVWRDCLSPETIDALVALTRAALVELNSKLNESARARNK